MSDKVVSRRKFFGVAGAGLAGLTLAGCDSLSRSESFQGFLSSAEKLNKKTQRALQSNSQLAREFSRSDISPVFKANGTLHPGGDAYAQMVASNFTDWRLKIDGLVTRPMSLSLDDLKKMPQRTQITRHDCVEGWSAIGEWTGVPLGGLLKAAGLGVNARYAVFHCADNLDGEPDKGGMQSPGQYYESIDLIDAFHPQTILAHTMNGSALPIAHGAPLRLRVERQLGYKQAKYITHIAIVDSFTDISGGKGGYWEDRGYEWYAGI